MKPKIALLAIHPAVVEMVLDPAALKDMEKTVELRRATPELWKSGWRPDPDVEVLVTGWGTPKLDDQALRGMPRLTGVFHAAGSVRDLVSEEVWSRGLAVVSAADANNERVADFVAAQILLALKGTHRARAFMREQRRLPGFAAGPGSDRQTIGLVSFGSIARKVRERLRSLNADVVVWDPYVSDEDLASAGVRRTDNLAELFGACAVVSVHAPLIPGVTEKMIGRELIDAMPRGATLLNTSRGAILDESAIIQVLQERLDLFAILDVTWPEPPADDSPLYDLPNVLLTGHTAGAVGSECRALGRLVADEVARFASGAPLRHAISRDEAAIRA
ncbi:hydroxyacid dehydrogenase [Arthrobacter sp. B2a2-09]|uniref:hydroxyacid dehydrogenase n=1 Tax=Arthrobacter sp. B2a2-09 TaxID=2952822 RepID=UPI0022CD24C2|nr:hydroxyacid dehydrogenase [Arthrobacter sp. B2a2-09]MCZ9880590.1 hydroxyacid dehydrogenase [Arthrobacter sp. B2a2-09]